MDPTIPAMGGLLVTMVGALVYVTKHQTGMIEKLIHKNSQNGMIGNIASDVKELRMQVMKLHARMDLYETRVSRP